MYNEELKRRYIKEKKESSTLPSNYLECQFNKIGSYEEELNKDVHDFTVYEIIEYYKMLSVASLEVLAVLNSHLSLYTQWCLGQSIVRDNQNHYEEIELETMKKCLNKVLVEKKIVSREQVIDWCEQLPNPKDQLVFLGLFEGIKGENFSEFVNLQLKDINKNNLTLMETHEEKKKAGKHPNGQTKWERWISSVEYREIKISDRLLKYIEDSVAAEIYYSCSDSETKIMPLIDMGYVIKYYPNTQDDTSAFQKGRVIYNGVARSLSYVGAIDYMSANNIFESGKIHMIRERAKELGISAKEYVYSEHIKEVEDRFNCKIVRSNFWLKYEDYLV